MSQLYIHFSPNINEDEIEDIGRQFRANLEQRTEGGNRKIVLNITNVLVIDNLPIPAANVGKYIACKLIRLSRVSCMSGGTFLVVE